GVYVCPAPITPAPSRCTLSPYTTLFRSLERQRVTENSVPSEEQGQQPSRKDEHACQQTKAIVADTDRGSRWLFGMNDAQVTKVVIAFESECHLDASSHG